MSTEDKNNRIVARMKLLSRIKNAQNVDPATLAALKQKLFNLWAGIVPSFVATQGLKPYNVGDLTVDFDTTTTPMRILANAKLPKMIAPELSKKIEDAFKNAAMNILPPELKGSMIAVGFAMPSGKPALPAKPAR